MVPGETAFPPEYCFWRAIVSLEHSKHSVKSAVADFCEIIIDGQLIDSRASV